MPEYKEHYVAFLDILGFKALLKNTPCDEIYSIFDIINNKSHGKREENGVLIEALDHVKHMILSDSIILYIEVSIEDAFAALMYICNQLQVSLANREQPILVRGGIAMGNLFCMDDIIYGEGLSAAYLLESNLAQYPRVIFTGNTLSKGLANTKYMHASMESLNPPYQSDNDELYYVNYLCPPWNNDELIQYFDRLLNVCTKYLDMNIDSNLRNKYLWLKEKTNDAKSHYPQIVEYYKKREEYAEQQRCENYNERLKIYSQYNGK